MLLCQRLESAALSESAFTAIDGGTARAKVRFLVAVPLKNPRGRMKQLAPGKENS